MAVGFGFCSNCGNPLSRPGQKFCSVCGATLSVETEPVVAPAAPAPEPAASTPEPAAPAPEPAAPGAVPPPWAGAQQQPPAPQPFTPQQPFPPQQPPASAPWQQPVPAGQPPVPPTPPVRGAKGLPIVPIVGVLAIVAVVGAVAYSSMNKPKATPLPSAVSGSPSAGASSSASLAPTTGPSAAPSGTKTAGKATIAVTPATFDCAATGNATLDITLPSTFSETDEITLFFDKLEIDTQAVSESFDQQTDGSWSASDENPMADLCKTLGVGKHTLSIADASGKTLAQNAFTITGDAVTPAPTQGTAGGGSIVMVPAIFSCSSTTTTISMAVVLPASLSATDVVTMLIDDQVVGSGPVGDGFEKQSDGTWLSSASDGKPGQLCVGTPGSHVIKIVDANKNVIAQQQYLTEK